MIRDRIFYGKELLWIDCTFSTGMSLTATKLIFIVFAVLAILVIQGAAVIHVNETVVNFRINYDTVNSDI
jgi:hypothetical protein